MTILLYSTAIFLVVETVFLLFLLLPLPPIFLQIALSVLQLVGILCFHNNSGKIAIADGLVFTGCFDWNPNWRNEES